MYHRVCNSGLYLCEFLLYLKTIPACCSHYLKLVHLGPTVDHSFDCTVGAKVVLWYVLIVSRENYMKLLFYGEHV